MYGRDHKRKLVLLNEGLYTIHSPYLSAMKEYISSSVFPSLIKSLTTSLIVCAKSELESAMDCP